MMYFSSGKLNLYPCENFSLFLPSNMADLKASYICLTLNTFYFICFWGISGDLSSDLALISNFEGKNDLLVLNSSRLCT